MKPSSKIYSRILLKLSGESFKSISDGYTIDRDALDYLALEIKKIHTLGVQIGIVVGGGNIWRGAQAQKEGMDRAQADYAGMLATIINALALQDALERTGKVNTRTQTAINVAQVAEPYIRRKAIRHLEKSRVVIFASGTGNPFMTTDTAAALRATEIDAKILIMAKHKADGIYERDPNLFQNPKKYESITHREVLEKRLDVMDTTALSLCMDNQIPILVFDIFKENSLLDAVSMRKVGSIVTTE
ncbi:MAG: UMP kinase [SAR202 cluster bacterium]|nr:UMP kinase [SAR202 cluster bacterium]